jgi:hypothetical protein
MNDLDERAIILAITTAHLRKMAPSWVKLEDVTSQAFAYLSSAYVCLKEREQSTQPPATGAGDYRR